jgi:hypothetical protein
MEEIFARDLAILEARAPYHGHGHGHRHQEAAVEKRDLEQIEARGLLEIDELD